MSVFKETEFLILEYWIRERDRIRAAKEAGAPKPWTEDPLLRDYRWCNVRRMDDRVSRWLFENWYDRNASPRDQLLRAALARLINWPDALAEIKSVLPDLEAAKRILTARADARRKVFTGAYIVPPPPRNEYSAGQSKLDGVLGNASALHTYAHEITSCLTMRRAWNEISKWEGLGPFLAGQIVADLAHTTVGCAWPDRSTWAPLGPGSARGINRLRGIPKDKTVSQAEFERLLPQLMDALRPRIADIWADRRLQAMDVQNCLCEYDKYRRLSLGEGKVRATYPGRAETERMFG